MARTRTLIACCLASVPLGQAVNVDDVSGLVQAAVRAKQQEQQQPWLAPMQPAPWSQPMAPPPQQQQQQQPPQPMMPQLVPWQPNTAPLLVPSTPGLSGPVNKYIFTLLPDNKMMCLQGPKSYLLNALERIRNSPMAPHYAGAQVTLGACKDMTYVNGPFPGTCFPRAAIFTDNDPLHVMTMIDFDESEAQFHAGNRNIPVEAAMLELKSACDDGAMEQGLQLASEEFQAQVYVPPQAALIPDNGMSCLQGTMSYLSDALKQIRTTAVGKIFERTEKPRPGMCSEHGYTVGSGSVVAAGHGRIKSKCFPKATLFWDRNATHLDQLMWAETRVMKGASHNFNFSRYEERKEEVAEICGGRAETVYQPLPPNLR